MVGMGRDNPHVTTITSVSGCTDNPRFGLNDWQEQWDQKQEVRKLPVGMGRAPSDECSPPHRPAVPCRAIHVGPHVQDYKFGAGLTQDQQSKLVTPRTNSRS